MQCRRREGEGEGGLHPRQTMAKSQWLAKLHQPPAEHPIYHSSLSPSNTHKTRHLGWFAYYVFFSSQPQYGMPG